MAYARGLLVRTSIALLVVAICGCRTKEQPKTEKDMIHDFMRTTLAAARDGNVDRLLDELTVCSSDDILWAAQQTGATKPSKDELDEKAIRLESKADVELFLRSYADLFSGDACSYSLAQHDGGSKDLKVFSLIIWVKDGQKYRGIKIDDVAVFRDKFKVLQWVEVSGYEASHGDLREKRAILETADPSKWKPSEWVQYKTVYGPR